MSVFREACVDSGITERAGMLLFNSLLKEAPAAALNSRLALESAKFARRTIGAHE